MPKPDAPAAPANCAQSVKALDHRTFVYRQRDLLERCLRRGLAAGRPLSRREQGPAPSRPANAHKRSTRLQTRVRQLEKRGFR